jgi:hypothetical protein
MNSQRQNWHKKPEDKVSGYCGSLGWWTDDSHTKFKCASCAYHIDVPFSEDWEDCSIPQCCLCKLLLCDDCALVDLKAIKFDQEEKHKLIRLCSECDAHLDECDSDHIMG